MARAGLPEEVSVQVPPNLAPAGEVVDCGIDDLGGVSPVTDDYINPAYAWPGLEELRGVADAGGMTLHERLPTHDRYLPDGIRRSGVDPAAPPSDVTGREWLPARIRDRILTDDVHGRRFRRVADREAPLEA
jgi:FO synthase subunit 1